MEMLFMNTENSKTNELHLNLKQRLELRSLNKYVALQNKSIYYTWKNRRQQKQIQNDSFNTQLIT